MLEQIISTEIYKTLSAPSYDYEITMYTADGEGTIDPSSTKWFYVNPDELMIEIPDVGEYNKDEVKLWKSAEEMSPRVQEVLKRLKTIINQAGYGLTVYDLTGNNVPKQFSHLALRNIESQQINESLNNAFYGSSYRSYYELPKVKLVIVHSKRINDENERVNNIKDMFIEMNGEKKRLSTHDIDSAKAIIMHLSNGGSLNDKYMSAIEQKARDLDIFNNMLPTLKKDSFHYNKMRDITKRLRKVLRSLSTETGYKRGYNEIISEPRISKLSIENFVKKLAQNETDIEPFNRLSHYLLRDSLSSAPDYAMTIRENLIGVDSIGKRDIDRLARQICYRGLNIPFIDMPDTDDIQGKMLLLGSALVECIDEPTLQEVLYSILSKPEITPTEGKFILALWKSGLPSMNVQRNAIEPEMQALREWAEEF